jgi:hypothetical protein
MMIQVDFSENFELKEQDEIQSAHWNSNSIFIFTAHAWFGTDNYPLTLTSNNVSHDRYCVSRSITYIMKKLCFLMMM